jgi:hypothetical protein
VEQQIEIDSGETSMHIWVPKEYAKARAAGTMVKKKKQPPVVLLHAFGPGAIWHWNAQASAFLTSSKTSQVPPTLEV